MSTGSRAMTSTTIPVLDVAPVPADEPPTVARPTGPTAGCTVLTLAVGAVAVAAPPHPAGVATALALAAVTISWSGGTAYRTAWAALRRGGRHRGGDAARRRRGGRGTRRRRRGHDSRHADRRAGPPRRRHARAS